MTYHIHEPSTTSTIVSIIASALSMAGWWTCCNCDQMNNPALTSGRCTVCSHSKCCDCKAT
ncbi:hypothetical protein ASPCADRAFT_208367 [Aspergillus carbonarius ITEM 5010]|uniref:RanBP2-type domain-containing protein n=1 Tax=Aspergillus carbonarius (strain ITEM 5010) TaxID=602072 RepID=A0A1R3RJQ3_ASPC5|nr:hypothetical protein ASPCADRAFT_208367 [Aspergillus carbonarius ITEM 5010]